MCKKESFPGCQEECLGVMLRVHLAGAQDEAADSEGQAMAVSKLLICC